MAWRAASVMTARPVWATTSTERVTPDTLPPRPARPHCGPASTAARRRSSSSGVGAGAQPQEVLDVAARSGQRARGDPPHAQAERGGLRPRRARTASARSAGSRTTPPLGRRSLPTSNCGFTIGSRSASGRAQRTSAGSTRPSGMKHRSATTRSTGVADLLRLERAHVRAVDDGHPLVGLQRPGQLPVADVDRHHVRRTALQQHVGEAARRRAGVEHPLPGRVVAEGVERAGELVAAARDVRRTGRLGDHQRRAGLDGGRRLAGRLPSDGHPSRRDQLGRLLTAAGQPAADQLGVEAGPAGQLRPRRGSRARPAACGAARRTARRARAPVARAARRALRSASATAGTGSGTSGPGVVMRGSPRLGRGAVGRGIGGRRGRGAVRPPAADRSGPAAAVAVPDPSWGADDRSVPDRSVPDRSVPGLVGRRLLRPGPSSPAPSSQAPCWPGHPSPPSWPGRSSAPSWPEPCFAGAFSAAALALVVGAGSVAASGATGSSAGLAGLSVTALEGAFSAAGPFFAAGAPFVAGAFFAAGALFAAGADGSAGTSAASAALGPSCSTAAGGGSGRPWRSQPAWPPPAERVPGPRAPSPAAVPAPVRGWPCCAAAAAPTVAAADCSCPSSSCTRWVSATTSSAEARPTRASARSTS